MDEKTARMYVKNLRYFYQELIVFACVLFIGLLPIGNAGAKLMIIMVAWGGFLAWRGKYFQLSQHVQKRWHEYSKKIKKHREDHKKSSSKRSK